MEKIEIILPKKDPGKIRSGIKVGSVIKSKRDKAKSWRKRKHKKGNQSNDSPSIFLVAHP